MWKVKQGRAWLETAQEYLGLFSMRIKRIAQSVQLVAAGPTVLRLVWGCQHVLSSLVSPEGRPL